MNRSQDSLLITPSFADFIQISYCSLFNIPTLRNMPTYSQRYLQAVTQLKQSITQKISQLEQKRTNVTQKISQLKQECVDSPKLNELSQNWTTQKQKTVAGFRRASPFQGKTFFTSTLETEPPTPSCTLSSIRSRTLSSVGSYCDL